MNNQELMLPGGTTTRSTFTVRDLLAVVFRHQRTAVVCFAGIMLGTVLAIIFNPYRATTKFLVHHERVDPVVTADQNSSLSRRPEVTEDEINSEIELMKSGDVLRDVVLTCGLDQHKSLSEYILGRATPEKRIAKAIKHLGSDLKIEPVNKSNVITVSYSSDDPKMAAKVLDAFGTAYIKEHQRVRTPPGQVEFFDQEADRYKAQLTDAEAKLDEFAKQQNGVAPHVARDIVLQKLTDFQSSLHQTRADLSTTQERIDSLEKQATTTPQRLTTSEWKEDNFQVLQNLKTTLNNLELKRTEYLTKYQPDYPLVQEVDKQIAQTQASIAAEEAKPIQQVTTDRNPTYSWINEELAKAKAEYKGLQAKETATQQTVASYEAQARDLQQKALAEQDLYRDLKTAEDNYQLYVRKRDQARMTEALDSTRIVNVSVAEQPVAPSMPYNSPALVGLIGILVAVTVTMGAVFTQEYLDPSFRTPTEVSAALNVPLLAAVPHRLNGFHVNGNGNGNGNGKNGHGNGLHSLTDKSITRIS